MKNTEYNSTYKPVGLTDLEALLVDLLKMNTHENHPFSVPILNNLIMKVDIIIKKIKYNPKLPLIQIEEEVIRLCNKDNTYHGVMIKILFTTKFGEINSSRLSNIIVNV